MVSSINHNFKCVRHPLFLERLRKPDCPATSLCCSPVLRAALPPWSLLWPPCSVRCPTVAVTKLCFLTVIRCSFYFFIFWIPSFFPPFFEILWVFKYRFLPFPPTPATPTSLPWFHLPLVLSLYPLQVFLKTLHPFPPIIPSHLPSGYCQIVLNFNVSGYILLACLFRWLVSS